MKKFAYTLLGLVIGLGLTEFVIHEFFQTVYIVKYDYVLQHILFYKEFYRLLQNGLPFWSWNSFLGLNFWASKAYYLIGDPYAWLGSLFNQPVDQVESILSTLLHLKFLVAFIGMYCLSSIWKLKINFRIIISLLFVFSGWNLVFMEHPMYTSFYSFIPFLFIGIELLINQRTSILIFVSVALLVSINFYLFWVLSVLVLIYWIIRWILIEKVSVKTFLIQSLKLLFFYSLGVLISAVIWYPSILHLLQSQRIGSSMFSYSEWTDVNIASFITFSLVPMLKYLDGLFKDYWYYFNQVGLYIGLLAWFLIPQALFSSKNKKEFWTTLTIILLLIGLLISPRIGLFFHFTYSIRYTLIHTFLGLYLISKAFKNMQNWKWWGFIISEGVILLSYYLITQHYIPLLHPERPPHIEELNLLRSAFILSFAYFIVLLPLSFTKKFKQKYISAFLQICLLCLVLYEVKNTTSAALVSQKNTTELPYYDTDFEKALDYIQSIDDGFYRIYTDYGSYSNLSLNYDYLSQSTYDTTYEYSLSKFLHWTRQYPETNWEFQFNDPTLTQTLGIQYAIVRNVSDDIAMTDTWFAEEIGTDQSFGQYHILKYKTDVSFATTYNTFADESELDSLDIESSEYHINELANKLNKVLYLDLSNHDVSQYQSEAITPLNIDPSKMDNNTLELNLSTQATTLLLLRMPYDEGWSILDNGNSINAFSGQGGFMILEIAEGEHHIEMNFIPKGYEFGLLIGKIALSLALLIDVLFIAYRTSRRLKPSDVNNSSEQRKDSV